jgi:hypothetical protein
MPQNVRQVTSEYAKKHYGFTISTPTPPPFSDEEPTLMPSPESPDFEVETGGGRFPERPKQNGDLF